MKQEHVTKSTQLANLRIAMPACTENGKFYLFQICNNSHIMSITTSNKPHLPSNISFWRNRHETQTMYHKPYLCFKGTIMKTLARQL